MLNLFSLSKSTNIVACFFFHYHCWNEVRYVLGSANAVGSHGRHGTPCIIPHYMLAKFYEIVLHLKLISLRVDRESWALQSRRQFASLWRRVEKLGSGEVDFLTRSTSK